MTKREVLKSVSMAAICFAVAAPAYARTGGDKGVEIDEILVTARKREESLREIPAAGAAFGAEQIQALGGITNTQALLSAVRTYGAQLRYAW
jgi:iron complex outermembrane receptor protein